MAEKAARPPVPSPAPGPASTNAKLRSCVICRRRKVRCDKLSPCTNCRRANIECVVPTNDRPPRWARRLDRLTAGSYLSQGEGAGAAPQNPRPGVGQVTERLRNLETLVKDLNEQLEQARAREASGSGADSMASSTHGQDTSPEAAPSSSGMSEVHMQKPYGRMVLHDKKPRRYVSGAFWSRVSDEIESLKLDARELADDDSQSSSDEEPTEKSPPSTYESSRASLDRNGFLFGYNSGISAPDLAQFCPLPSQVPFLLDVFSENVNIMLQAVHMPTVRLTARSLRGTETAKLSNADECLLLSIYYAAVTSMDEDEVVTNFGTTKAALNLKFRVGLEQALARTDFLDAPELKLVQALGIFLYLARRHDKPRFVWMLTGLAIRMAQAIGLHRDGSNFPDMAPFEVEMRRRVWWLLCSLDLRTSEDQGMELSIQHGSFDTKVPININDADISPDMRQPPVERHGITDMTSTLMIIDQCVLTRQMMSPEVRSSDSPIREQSRLLGVMHDKMETRCLQYNPDQESIISWVAITSIRLVISKMNLFIHLPDLFSSPGPRFSEGVRGKLLVSAIEVAEYNHALNAEQRARQWRWIYQSYTHWNAIVYLLLEAGRRPWSPVMERTWIALHSRWLIPADHKMDKSSPVWIPLRRLMSRARKHREKEIDRLRRDPVTCSQLEVADRDAPTPASTGPFGKGDSEEIYRQHWRNLVSSNGTSGVGQSTLEASGISNDTSFAVDEMSTEPGLQRSSSRSLLEGALHEDSGREFVSSDSGSQLNPTSASDAYSSLGMSTPGPRSLDANTGQGDASYNAGFPGALDLTSDQAVGDGFTTWPWTDDEVNADLDEVNMNMDLDQDVDWNSWLRSATIMDTNANGAHKFGDS